MAEPVDEAGVVRAIARAVKAKYPDSFVWKVHGGPYQGSGQPDLAMCVHGLYVGIEVKHQKPGESEKHARNRATPGQRQKIKEIINAGGIAGVALNVPEALEIIERGLRRLEEKIKNVT